MARKKADTETDLLAVPEPAPVETLKKVEDALEKAVPEMDRLRSENEQLKALVDNMQKGIEKLKNVLVQKELKAYDETLARATSQLKT